MTVNSQEITHFSNYAAQWWDESGPYKILHSIAPLRIEYILSQTGDVAGKKFLDVGCGGGLICEPLSRLGGDVTGLDADPEAIQVARNHAETVALPVTYINGDIESHDAVYDIVLALEIIEHVDDPAGFIDACAARLKPGGVMIVSTLNKTPASFALGIVAAEYVLDIVPRGTHTWSKFVKPHVLRRYLKHAGVTVNDIMGLHANPINDTYRLDENAVNVNYFMSGVKNP